MGLGNNRDYKTNARRVKNNLKAHRAMMAVLMEPGWSLVDASVLAYRIVSTSAVRRAVWRSRS